MKLASTISLPKPIKSLAYSSAFDNKEDRRYFLNLMVQLEYQHARQARQRVRGTPDAGSDDARE